MPYAWIWFSLAGYLLGSVPFGKIIARRVSGVDISKEGSGNIGATNVSRVVGLSWGIITLILDVSKGILPVVLYMRYCGEGSWPMMLNALAPVVGHQFSIFAALRGGKGVATAIGVWIVLAPISLITALGVFAAAAAIWRYVSLASLAFSLALPIVLLISGNGPHLVATSVVTAVLILIKHKDNIERISNGTEPRWGRGNQERR